MRAMYLLHCYQRLLLHFQSPKWPESSRERVQSEVSGVVHTKLGYHIIKIDDTRPPEYAEYARVRESIREKIKRQRVQELMQQLKKDPRSKARVVTNEVGLQALKIEDNNETPVFP